MNVKKINYYGFSQAKVTEKFEGDPIFVNSMCLSDDKGRYYTANVYHVASPNVTKGHKEYMMLSSQNGISWVSGRSAAEMEKDRYVTGVLCLACNEVVVSVQRHAMEYCGCSAETFVDGGRDYTRCGSNDPGGWQVVQVDMLKSEVVLHE